MELNPETVAMLEADRLNSIHSMAETYRGRITRLQGLLDEVRADYAAGVIGVDCYVVTKKTFETSIREMKDALAEIGEDV